MLLDDSHTVRKHFATGCQLVEVCSGGEICCVEVTRVNPCLERFMYQHRHLLAENVRTNRAVLTRAKKSLIYQNAKRHNRTTTIIVFNKGSVVVCAVICRCARSVLFHFLVQNLKLSIPFWFARERLDGKSLLGEFVRVKLSEYIGLVCRIVLI